MGGRPRACVCSTHSPGRPHADEGCNGAPALPGWHAAALSASRLNSRTGTLPSPLLLQVQSSYTYWSGYSLPPRKDGVFRAVPNSAAQEGNKVVAQYGCWTAIVRWARGVLGKTGGAEGQSSRASP